MHTCPWQGQIRQSTVNVPARLAVLILLAVVLAAGLVWHLTTTSDGGGDEPKDPDAARIEQLKRSRDVATLAKEAAGAKVQVARRAVQAMGHIGPKAAPEIRKVMKDPRDEVREAAVVALGRVSAHVPPPEDMAALAETSREDKAEKVRAAAVTALGGMHAFEEMETLLTAMQEDESIDVRRRAGAAVARIIGVDVDFKAGDLPQKRQQSIERFRVIWRNKGDRVRRYRTAIRKQRSGG